MQRIKRHATYYTDRRKQNHWCDGCHELLKADETIVLDDGSDILKKELQEFKNDALPEEAWVHCDQCHSWVHQICTLFNGRTNKSTATYTCPNCHLKKTNPEDTLTQMAKRLKGAEDLTHGKMSTAIEKGLNEALHTAYKEKAEELGIGVDQVEKAGGLTVRVVSSMEKKHFVGDEVRTGLLLFCCCHCPASLTKYLTISSPVNTDASEILGKRMSDRASSQV
jgi:E1A/CREB-binding protein